MKQVTHTLKSGSIDVAEVPIPTLTDRYVLVRTAASVISAGTEKTKIDMGKKSLLLKARARPDLVKQVIRKLRTEGLAKTLSTLKLRASYGQAGNLTGIGAYDRFNNFPGSNLVGLVAPPGQARAGHSSNSSRTAQNPSPSRG